MSPRQVKSNFYLSCCKIPCPKYIVKLTCTEFFACPPDIGWKYLLVMPEIQLVPGSRTSDFFTPIKVQLSVFLSFFYLSNWYLELEAVVKSNIVQQYWVSTRALSISVIWIHWSHQAKQSLGFPITWLPNIPVVNVRCNSTKRYEIYHILMHTLAWIHLVCTHANFANKTSLGGCMKIYTLIPSIQYKINSQQ